MYKENLNTFFEISFPFGSFYFEAYFSISIFVFFFKTLSMFLLMPISTGIIDTLLENFLLFEDMENIHI